MDDGGYAGSDHRPLLRFCGTGQMRGMAAVLQNIVYPHELNTGGNDLIWILERGYVMNVEYDPGI